MEQVSICKTSDYNLSELWYYSKVIDYNLSELWYYSKVIDPYKDSS